MWDIKRSDNEMDTQKGAILLLFISGNLRDSRVTTLGKNNLNVSPASNINISNIFNIHSADNDDIPILPEVWCDDTLHDDCINGVSFHPSLSGILATCSGQRHHKLNLSAWNCSSDEESGNEENYSEESSLKVWDLDLN